MAVQEQVPAIPTEAPVAHGAPATTTDADVGMQVDEPSQQRASSKRKAEEEPESDTHKKAKVGEYKSHSGLCPNLNFHLV